MGLIVIGQMIFIAYQISRAKVFLGDSIKKVNQEIYPKEVSIYLQRLVNQLEQLDEYSIRSKFIFVIKP